MSAITRWDPFREMDELQGRLSTLFGRAPVRKEGERQEALRVAEWAPLVDITEDPKEYLVKAELPEVKAWAQRLHEEAAKLQQKRNLEHAQLLKTKVSFDTMST